MTIDSFVKQYNQLTGKAQENFINKVIQKKYVPFLEKRILCSSIIEKSCYKEVDERKVFSPNSHVRVLMMTMKMIDIYTDIDIDGEERLDVAYDKLQQYRLCDILLEKISEVNEADVNEMQVLFDMAWNDVYSNETNIVAYLGDLRHGMEKLIGALQDASILEE